MGDGRRKPDLTQGDLFAANADALFPVRARATRMRSPDLSLRIKTAMGQALKDCPEPATVVAARMSDLLGREITADALYTYTAPSKADHEISLIRFVAFVRAVEAPWLWDVLVEDEGLVVIAGEDANFAQLGALRQRRTQLDDMIRSLERDLKARPGPTSRGRPEPRRATAAEIAGPDDLAKRMAARPATDPKRGRRR